MRPAVFHHRLDGNRAHNSDKSPLTAILAATKHHPLGHPLDILENLKAQRLAGSLRAIRADLVSHVPMSPTPPRKRRTAGQIKQLAEALGISRRRVSTLLLDGMPVDITEALAWRGQSEPASISMEDDSPAELRRRRIALLRKQEQKLAVEIDVRRGQLIDRGEVFAASLFHHAKAKAKLLTLPNSLPGRLAGLSEAKMSAVIRDEIIELLTELSEASTPYKTL